MARWNPVKTCTYCQRNGDVKRLCRIRARDLRKKANAKKQLCMNTGAVIEGISNTSSSSHGYVFAATQRWKRLAVILLSHFMQNQVLALRETRNRIQSHVTQKECRQVQARTAGLNPSTVSTRTTAMTKWNVVASWFQIVSVKRPRIPGNKVVFEEDCSRSKTRMGIGQSWWCKAPLAGWKQSFWTGQQTGS